MTIHRPRRPSGERLLIAVTNTVSAGYAALYVAYLLLLLVGGR